ncbi:hypothetical protein TNCV_4580821 [Trichonephila clavipes]|nr:hypothetical protein TNCV_4580821 [Trichonephila clavipes]
MIVSKLKADGLDIINYRGQAYDNAAMMAGCYTDVRQRIKDINPNAEFVPCSNHPLNLVCVHAASLECCYAQNYLQTDGLDIHSWAKKIRALQTVLEAKLEEFMDDTLIYAKSLCEELEISFEPPRRIGRKHIFGDGSKDLQLSYEDDLRRAMFSLIDRVTTEIRERFQQLQNLAQKYAFLRPKVIFSMDGLNLDQAPQDINKEFQLESVRLQAFVAATEPDCKKEFIRSSSLGLLKYIIESKLEVVLPSIVIMLRLFLTSAFSNASWERSFSKLKLIKNYLRSTMSMLRLTNLATLAIEHDIHINIDKCIKDFALKKNKHEKCIFNQ